MYSPCRTDPRMLALAAAFALMLPGCDRQDRSAPYVPGAEEAPRAVVLSQLLPGGTPPPAEDPRGRIYEGDAVHIANGRRYYTWYNCAGCHFNGGGGIGPAFMDATWIYGGRIEDIHNSIAEGRPNGMPTWGNKIPDARIWEIAAYVRSLSSPAVQLERPPRLAPAEALNDPHSGSDSGSK